MTDPCNCDGEIALRARCESLEAENRELRRRLDREIRARVALAEMLDESERHVEALKAFAHANIDAGAGAIERGIREALANNEGGAT